MDNQLPGHINIDSENLGKDDNGGAKFREHMNHWLDEVVGDGTGEFAEDAPKKGVIVALRLPARIDASFESELLGHGLTTTHLVGAAFCALGAACEKTDNPAFHAVWSMVRALLSLMIEQRDAREAAKANPSSEVDPAKI